MTTPYSGFGFDYGALVANADMNDKVGKFVTTGSVAGEFKLATGASAPMPLGVLFNDPRQGEPGVIRILGTARVSASNAIGYGDYVTANASGNAIVVTASGKAAGVALTALSSGAGYIEVLLIPAGFAGADNTP